MNAGQLQERYESRKLSFETEMESLQGKIISISWLRVIAGIILLIFIYLAWYNNFWYLLVVADLICYVLLVRKHNYLNDKKVFLKNLITINDREVRAQSGIHDGFEDGTEFMNATHPFASDLDIFGKGSIFQRMNRSCTEPGKERLADILREPLSTLRDIEKRQEAINELSDLLDFRQDFQATGMASQEKSQDQQELLKWLDIPTRIYGIRKYTIILILFPLMSLASLTYFILSGQYAPFALVTLSQWGIVGMHGKWITLFQDYIGKKKYLLVKFSRHFRLLNEQHFEKEINKELVAQCSQADHELKKLSSLSELLDLRLNAFVGPILNGLMMIDLWNVYRLEKWRERNRSSLPAWLEAIREADALNSMASFVFNNPEFEFPIITDEDHFSAEQLGHPLLPHEGRVCNDVQMNAQSNVWIVTGANMAGKSTFLRSVGVNVVLALSGLVVCARKMSCPLMHIYTGMQTTDSINDNQSYFFAELLRLQMIIERLRKGDRLLILLDEILKGTNSSDKLTGSEELVKQLTDKRSFTMVATHDVALGEMEKSYPQVKNYHFETFIDGDELSFDYKLKPGVSTGKNATFLMRRMGIIAN